MNKTLSAIFLGVAALGMAESCSAGDSQAPGEITVNVDPSITQKEFTVEYGYLSDMVKPRSERPMANRETLKVKDGKFEIKTLPDGAAQYVIPANDREYVIIYTEPGDKITVNLDRLSPLAYSITGSTLMEGIARMDNESATILNTYRDQVEQGTATAESLEKVSAEYEKVFTDYIKENPDSKAVPYAILNLEGESFLDAYAAMTPAAKSSPIAIFLEPQKRYVEQKIEADRKKVQLESGTVEAPDFTFADAKGKMVSLSDFRGKWVIIDFWGSWCPWCIKGFPELKEAYAQYKPNLEIIGVDCRDSRDTWLAALDKYQLPWVNVYNPDQNGGKVLEDYAVEGFPTKVIVNPEGKIVNITSGHNPAFFEVLKKLL